MSTPPPEPARRAAPGASSAAEHDALPPGTRFGELEIVRVLGVGGFGIVYLALDHSLEREVALKEYMPASLAARGVGPAITVRSGSHAETYAIGLRSFVNEARLLARFDHPSLVKVYRFWEDNATAYMVMPYLQGRTLRDARRAMAQAPDETWLRSVVDPVMHALELLHREGVFHRDIAPDNILLPPEGVPVLLDFGAARRVISDRTQSLTAILKPSYAPIEQYADMTALRQGPWTDVYALGAVVHFLLLGVPPAPATARALQDDMVPLEQRAFPGVSPRFLAAIDWALALRPTDRPQSIDALRAAMDGRVTPPARQRHDITVPGATSLMPVTNAGAAVTASFEPTLHVQSSSAPTELDRSRLTERTLPPASATNESQHATVVLTAAERTAAFAAAAAATQPPPVARPAPAMPPTSVAPKQPGAVSAPSSKRGLAVAAVVVVAVLGFALAWQFMGHRDTATAPVVATEPAVAAPAVAPPAVTAPAVTAAPPAAEPPVTVAPAPAVEATPAPAPTPTPTPTPTQTPAAAVAAEPARPQAPAILPVPATRPSVAAVPLAPARGKVATASAPPAVATRSRESVVADRPAEPVAEARPRVAPPDKPAAATTAQGPATAREACGKRVLFALWTCIERECQDPRYSQQAECVKLQEEKRSREYR